MNFKVVIPARYESSRLPGKPLADIDGIPMVVRVAQRALASQANEVVVATDDKRVVDLVTKHNIAVELTDIKHPSGSDRVMEVATIRGWQSDDIVVNVQGDEPLIPPAVINQVAALLQTKKYGVATLSESIHEQADVDNPNVVKVVTDADGSALYFSRAPIPFRRDKNPVAGDGQNLQVYRRHLGIYAYRLSALQEFVSTPPSSYELVEALEQLRVLQQGIKIIVADACEFVPAGVDTQEDLDRVRDLVQTSR